MSSASLPLTAIQLTISVNRFPFLFLAMPLAGGIFGGICSFSIAILPLSLTWWTLHLYEAPLSTYEMWGVILFSGVPAGLLFGAIGLFDKKPTEFLGGILIGWYREIESFHLRDLARDLDCDTSVLYYLIAFVELGGCSLE